MLNLKLTLESGQMFIWYKINENWCIINGSDVIIVSDDLKTFESYIGNTIKHIFRLDDDIDEINSSISKDAIIKDAIVKFNGLRIMRQDPFQCLISFICSSNTNIHRIKNMLMNILNKFGEKIVWEGYEFKLFPKPKTLAKASINDLVNCGLGFRARYVKDASHTLANECIEQLKYLKYEDAKEEIMKFKGVGNKVADCVLLFALEHLEAFPIDRWIFRILKSYYNIDEKQLSNKTYKLASSKMRGYFGRYAGYAQQYLYCYSKS